MKPVFVKTLGSGVTVEKKSSVVVVVVVVKEVVEVTIVDVESVVTMTGS